MGLPLRRRGRPRARTPQGVFVEAESRCRCQISPAMQTRGDLRWGRSGMHGSWLAGGRSETQGRSALRAPPLRAKCVAGGLLESAGGMATADAKCMIAGAKRRGRGEDSACETGAQASQGRRAERSVGGVLRRASRATRRGRGGKRCRLVRASWQARLYWEALLGP